MVHSNNEKKGRRNRKKKKDLDPNDENYVQNDTVISLKMIRKPFSCGRCKKKFKGLMILSKHLLRMHDKEKYKCESCEKCFKFQTHLKKHQNTHDIVQAYQCKTCSKYFTSLKSLEIHYKSNIHNGEIQYKCEICDICFVKEDYLNEHQNEVHDEPRSTEDEPNAKETTNDKLKKKTITEEIELIESIIKVEPEDYIEISSDDDF